MVKVNSKEVTWGAAPNFTNHVQRQVLWTDPQTGATFAILRIPEGTLVEEAPHGHPHANQLTWILSGAVEYPDGNRIAATEGDYLFMFHSKNVKHGAFPKGTKVLQDVVYLHYWDGPEDWGE